MQQHGWSEDGKGTPQIVMVSAPYAGSITVRLESFRLSMKVTRKNLLRLPFEQFLRKQ